MKITTHNSDGTTSVVEYSDLVPEYIQSYCRDTPIITLDEDEFNIMMTKELSFKKILLTQVFLTATIIDYCNYRNSLKNSNEPIFFCDWEQFYNRAKNNSEIIDGNKALSELLRLYNTRDYFETNNTQNVKITSTRRWLEVLYYHAILSAFRNNKESRIQNAILKSFHNLLYKFYYASRMLECYPSVLCSTIFPFINRFTKENHKDSHLAVEKLLLSLHESNYSNRETLYDIISIIESLSDKNIDVFDLYQYECKTIDSNIGKISHHFTLDDANRNTIHEITLTEAELVSLKSQQENNKILADLRNILNSIYESHMKDNLEQFTNEIITDADCFFIEHDSNSWAKYKVYYRNTRLKDSAINDTLKPEECFYNIALSNSVLGEPLSFENENIISDLFFVLKNNESKSQFSLYKCMISYNYIKVKSGEIQNDEVTKTIEVVKQFLEPLYESKFVNKGFKNHIDDFVNSFLWLHDVRLLITKVTPNKFEGNFNLKLIYNFLGLLSEKNIISRKGKQIDVFLRDKAIENGLLSQKVERKHYINDYMVGRINDMRAAEAMIEEKLADLQNAQK